MTGADDERLALLPCPFCGSPAEYDSQRWRPPTREQYQSATGHAVTCSSCPAEIGLFECYEDAAEAWNRRAEIARLRAPAGGDLVERARQALHRGSAPYGKTLDEVAAALAAVQREAREASIEEAVQIADKWANDAHHLLDSRKAAKLISDAIRSLSGTAPQSGWRPEIVKERIRSFAAGAEGAGHIERARTALDVLNMLETADNVFDAALPSPPTEDAT